MKKKDEWNIIDSRDSGYPNILCGLDLSVLDPFSSVGLCKSKSRGTDRGGVSCCLRFSWRNVTKVSFLGYNPCQCKPPIFTNLQLKANHTLISHIPCLYLNSNFNIIVKINALITLGSSLVTKENVSKTMTSWAFPRLSSRVSQRPLAQMITLLGDHIIASINAILSFIIMHFYQLIFNFLEIKQ